MNVFDEVFGVKVPVISVIHLDPLPGTPLYAGKSVKEIAEVAVEEAVMLEENNIDGLIIENFGDKMFCKKVGPEIVAAMSVIAQKIKDEVKIPIGICILQSDGMADIAVAKAVEADFVRIPYYTETSIVDAGMMDSIAADVLRFRRYLEAKVKIFADVHIKHSYPLAQRPIEHAAEDCWERGLADAVIVTGRKTGGATKPEDIINVRKALPELPLIVGSGVSAQNVDAYLDYVDAIIVATSLNKDGRVEEKPDEQRVRSFMDKIKAYRKEKSHVG